MPPTILNFRKEWKGGGALQRPPCEHLELVNLGVEGLVDDVEDRDELHGQQTRRDRVEVLNLTVQPVAHFHKNKNKKLLNNSWKNIQYQQVRLLTDKIIETRINVILYTDPDPKIV